MFKVNSNYSKKILRSLGQTTEDYTCLLYKSMGKSRTGRIRKSWKKKKDFEGESEVPGT